MNNLSIATIVAVIVSLIVISGCAQAPQSPQQPTQQDMRQQSPAAEIQEPTAHAEQPVEFPQQQPTQQADAQQPEAAEADDLYKDRLNNEIKREPCPNEIIVLKEEKEGELLLPTEVKEEPKEREVINADGFLEKFYQKYDDEYDFLIVFTKAPLTSSYSLAVNREIRGIGEISAFQAYTKYTKRLKVLAPIAHFSPDVLGGYYPLPSSLVTKTILHELGHYWCCYLKLFGEQSLDYPFYTFHWISNLDLFYGDAKYVDILSYYRWIIEDDKEECVEINSEDAWKRFSDLTLYIMGLIPPEEVKPIKLHEFEKQEDAAANQIGPACYQNPKFTNTREIPIQNIIDLNGKREPSYSESQKIFKTAFVIVAQKNEEVDNSFIDSIEEYRSALPIEWAKATNYKSTMTVC